MFKSGVTVCTTVLALSASITYKGLPGCVKLEEMIPKEISSLDVPTLLLNQTQRQVKYMHYTEVALVFISCIHCVHGCIFCQFGYRQSREPF
jgi:hypothetical protein